MQYVLPHTRDYRTRSNMFAISKNRNRLSHLLKYLFYMLYMIYNFIILHIFTL